MCIVCRIIEVKLSILEGLYLIVGAVHQYADGDYDGN